MAETETTSDKIMGEPYFKNGEKVGRMTVLESMWDWEMMMWIYRCEECGEEKFLSQSMLKLLNWNA